MADFITKCPKCGKNINRIRYIDKETEKEKEFIGCSGYKEGCNYRPPFSTYINAKLSNSAIKELIENGETSKPVSIKVRLKFNDGKISMIFPKF
ncbi:MAG: hypothetical protein ACOCRX_01945 [Candidatus Woesearchaeota archaeon]